MFKEKSEKHFAYRDTTEQILVSDIQFNNLFNKEL